MKLTKLDETALEDLIAKLRAGSLTEGEHESLYLSYAGLALTIAGNYRRRYPPRYAEDINSESLCGLGLALRDAPAKLYDGNFTKYVRSRVMRHVSNYLRTERVKILNRQQLFADMSGVSKQDFGHRVADWHEELFALAKSRQEREYLALAFGGLGLDDIAKSMHLSEPSVYRVRQKLKERWEQRAKAHRTP